METTLLLIFWLMSAGLAWLLLAGRVAELRREVSALQKQVDRLARSELKAPGRDDRPERAPDHVSTSPPRPANTAEVLTTLVEVRGESGVDPEKAAAESEPSEDGDGPDATMGSTSPPRADSPARSPGSPPGTPPARPRTRKPPAAPSPKIDWERWVGIRGAAVVGSIALVLAGLFFVQVAIERGWLGPAARDLLALGTGALALLAHGPLRKRKLRTLADSVAGAGTVLMYGGAWAAARLHDLVPPSFALVVMAATTGTALLLSLRSNAPILASFALVGGFATPVLLGTLQRESTATLFGYVLVLDLTIIALRRLRGWALLIPGALIGTTLLQFAWSETNASRPPSLAVVALFGAMSAILFTAAIVRGRGRPGTSEDPDPWITLVALATPFVLMGRQLVASIPIDTPMWTVAAFIGVLACASAAASAHFRTAFYMVGSAMSSVALLGALRLRTSPRDTTGEWTWSGNVSFDQWALYTLALTVLFMALAAWVERRSVHGEKPGVKASGAPYAFALLSIFPGAMLARVGHFPVEGTFVGVTFLLALLGCHGARFAKGGHWPGALLGLFVGWTAVIHNTSAYGVQDFDRLLFWSIPAFSLACAGLAHGLGFAGRRDLASALSSMAPFVALAAFGSAAIRVSRGPVEALFLAAAAAGAIAFACAWPVNKDRHAVGEGLRHACMALATAAVAVVLALLNAQTRLPWRPVHLEPPHPAMTVAALGFLVGALPMAASIRARRVLQAPTLSGHRQVTSTRFISWVAALPLLLLLVAPASLGAMLWASSLGSESIMEAFRAGGLRHALLVGGSLIALASGLWTDRVDRRAAIGALSVASVLAAAIVAREFSARPTTATVSWSTGALALIAARAGVASLTQVAGVFALMPVVAILLFTFVGGAFLATDVLLPLQLTLDFGLILVGTIATHVALGQLRPQPNKVNEVGDAIPALRYAHGASILALLFGWMNAAVLNQFADPGEPIRFMGERMQARDLSLSLSWGVFAGALLAWGMLKHSATLRWTSLCLFVAFILKVFLYDLGALTGLSRVGSFLGLAVALLGVSLLYARVLGTEPEPPIEADRESSDAGYVPPPEEL